MNVDLEKEFKQKRTDDLAYIVQNPNEYTEEAVKQASIELEHRKLNPKEYAEHIENATERTEFDAWKRQVPLTISDKILLSLVPFRGNRITLMNFESQGYDTKFAQANEMFGWFIVFNLAGMLAIFLIGALIFNLLL